MRANEFIFELFDSSADYKWLENNGRDGEAIFVINDVTYYYYYERRGDLLNISFYSSDEDGLHQEITGTGNQQQVFATSVLITRSLLDAMPEIQEITFSAVEPSRQRLYSRMTQRLLPDWTTVVDQGSFSLKKNPKEVKEMRANEFIKEEDPCWKGYRQYGTKKKKGKTVPNCVPIEETYHGDEFYETYGIMEDTLEEAEYQGHKVTLNKPMQGDVKKFKVYVKDPKTGNIKKVNFGDKNMRIKKSNPARRKSFRARHHCENPGPKTKARYWSCRKW